MNDNQMNNREILTAELQALEDFSTDFVDVEGMRVRVVIDLKWILETLPSSYLEAPGCDAVWDLVDNKRALEAAEELFEEAETQLGEADIRYVGASLVKEVLPNHAKRKVRKQISRLRGENYYTHTNAVA